MESVGTVGGTKAFSFPSSLASGGDGVRLSSQPSAKETLETPKHQFHTQAATKRVRKVHKIPPSRESAAPHSSNPKTAWSSSEASKPPPPASSLITTSSWRAGQELREKILKGDDKGVDRMDDRSSRPGRRREEISPVHQSIALDSQSNLSSSQENISAISSLRDAHIQPERKLSKEPQFEQGGSSSRAKKKDETSSRGRVALDVAGMLKDLESPASPLPPSSPPPSLGLGREGREREPVRLGQTKSTTLAGGGPSSKKPQYNYGEPHCCK